MTLGKYPKYKDSGVEWIGEIPEGWNCTRIKRLSPIYRGASPRPIDDPKYFDDNGEFSWVRIADVSASERYLENTTQMLSELGASLSVKRYPGDLFLSIAGTVGKPIIAKIKCCIHDGFVYFPELKINPEFLYYIFICGESYKGLGKMGTQLNLNTRTVGEIFVPLPSNNATINEIVKHLDFQTAKLQQLIDFKRHQIELLQEHEKSLIHNAVTKGLDPKAKMKESGVEWIGKIPENWGIKRIKYLAGDCDTPVQTGPFGAQLHAEDYEEQGVPLILIRNVYDQKINPEGIPFISEKNAARLSMYRLQPGDFVFSRVGSLGRCALVTDNEKGWLISGQMLRLRLRDKKLNLNYLGFLLQSRISEDYLSIKSVGSTRESLNTGIILNMPITLPPFEEQITINNYLENNCAKLHKAINNLENQINHLEEYKKSMIYEVVTGKVRVG